MTKKQTVERGTAIKNGTTRLILTGIALAVQILWIFFLITRLHEYFEWLSLITGLIAVVLVLVIYAKHETASLKMPWIMLIMAFPVLEAQKTALKKAEHFIFMEYHAIKDAEAWRGIHDILVEKVREGVEV